MTDITNIYSDFRTNYNDNPDFPIDFYEKNSVILNNIQQFNDKDELKLYIEILEKYVSALCRKGNYNSAIDTIDKQQIVIDNEISRLNANDVKDAWYYSLQFVKGMASYNLKDYKTSTPIFKELVEQDSQNDMFKNWLNYSKYAQNIWLVRMINIACAILIFIPLIFKSQIPDYHTRQEILFLGFAGAIANWAYELYIKRNMRKADKC